MGCQERVRNPRTPRAPDRGHASPAIAAIIALCLAIPSATAFANSSIASDEASAFIDRLGDRVISLLADSKNVTNQQIRRFRKIFSEALDLDLIARQVLGRHWRTATEAQRSRYVPLFSEYVVQLYAVQFSNYSGESFAVVKEQATSPTDRIVKTRIIRDNGKSTFVNFRVRKANGRLKVVDVAIRGVSLLVTKRSEFDAIIRRHGLNGLLEQLGQRVGNAETNPDPISKLARESSRDLEALTRFGYLEAGAP